MTPYADSNFFTRFYLDLPETNRAVELVQRASALAAQTLPITWLHRLEVVNALQLHVFGGRQHGQPSITAEQAAIGQAKFREDLARTDLLRQSVLSQDQLQSAFEDLSLRHTARHGFRTYDILHVASALLLGCDTFWSFDTKASRLAKLEGLRTIRT
jgi:predicted nucleic acid-binding protein